MSFIWNYLSNSDLGEQNPNSTHATLSVPYQSADQRHSPVSVNDLISINTSPRVSECNSQPLSCIGKSPSNTSHCIEESSPLGDLDDSQNTIPLQLNTNLIEGKNASLSGHTSPIHQGEPNNSEDEYVCEGTFSYSSDIFPQHVQEAPHQVPFEVNNRPNSVTNSSDTNSQVPLLGQQVSPISIRPLNQDGLLRPSTTRSWNKIRQRVRITDPNSIIEKRSRSRSRSRSKSKSRPRSRSADLFHTKNKISYNKLMNRIASNHQQNTGLSKISGEVGSMRTNKTTPPYNYWGDYENTSNFNRVKANSYPFTKRESGRTQQQQQPDLCQKFKSFCKTLGKEICETLEFIVDEIINLFPCCRAKQANKSNQHPSQRPYQGPSQRQYDGSSQTP